MPPLSKLKVTFLGSLSDCRVLYRHCLTPNGVHTNAGVEAAFLQMFKSWESLLEDCTVAFLCGHLRCDGNIVPCNTYIKSEAFARVLLYQDRKFIEWTEVDTVTGRWKNLFGDPNVMGGAIKAGLSELRQMKTIRNAIAHSSPEASKRLDTLAGQQSGVPTTKLRPANFLMRPYPGDPTRTYFDRYADVLEVAAVSLTG